MKVEGRKQVLEEEPKKLKGRKKSPEEEPKKLKGRKKPKAAKEKVELEAVLEEVALRRKRSPRHRP